MFTDGNGMPFVLGEQLQVFRVRVVMSVCNLLSNNFAKKSVYIIIIIITVIIHV